MLIQQYIDDFNNQIGDIKFLSYTDEIVLSNKLKLIQCQFTDVDLKDVEVWLKFSTIFLRVNLTLFPQHFLGLRLLLESLSSAVSIEQHEVGASRELPGYNSCFDKFPEH